MNVLCAGAVKGLVLALLPTFESASGVEVRTTFGAVGAMRDALRSGAPCDVFIVTDPMIDAMIASGELRGGSNVRIGRVQTAIAVKTGSAKPAIDSATSLEASLLAASALYFPDAALSTAGAHVASVLSRLGIDGALAPRLRMFANGATAMRALADDPSVHAVGCTQATEIRYTPGLDLVGPLPAPFGLATGYGAALTATATEPAVGARFIALLAGPESLPMRLSGGFEA